MRVCSVHGCGTIYAASEGSKCEKHRTEAKQAHWANTRAYNTKGHKAFRSAVLAKDPICVICHIAQSQIADHYPHARLELIELGLNPNDPAYGRGLCKRDHDRETAKHQPGGWNNRD